MKKRSVYFFGLLLAFVLFGFQNSLNAQNSCESEKFQFPDVRDIINNPGPYIGDIDTVVGFVKSFIPESNITTAHYLFEGKFGATIRVNTDVKNEPEKHTQYMVIGPIYSDAGIPFIHENSRTKCVDVPTDDDNDGVPNNIDKCPNTAAGAEVDSTGCKKPPPFDPILLIIGGGALLVIIIIVIVIIGQNKKKAEEENRRQQEIERRRRDDERKATEANKSKRNKGTESDDDFKTIKIFLDDPKTMKFIPGKLEIISGDDKGRTFLISGYPTPEGSVVTLGRENVTDDRRYAHIQLDKRFQTVSRKQAELIYRSGKLYAKNLSSVNPTQVDGKELKVDQIAEVMPGSVIRTGELEFKYTL